MDDYESIVSKCLPVIVNLIGLKPIHTACTSWITTPKFFTIYIFIIIAITQYANKQI